MYYGLFFLSYTHAVVDASSAALAFYLWQNKLISTEQVMFLFIIYNILAFGLQAPLGTIADKHKLAKIFTISGCLAMIVALFGIKWSLLLSIYFAGIGNALFHVGGGIFALNMANKKASIPGIFVAPGALGLLIGAIVGKEFFTPWPFIGLLLFSAMYFYFAKLPKISYENKIKKPLNILTITIFLILLSIVIRSIVGLAIIFPWKQNFLLLVILTMAVFLGKAFGGILADRFGWMKVAMLSLLVSAMILPFGVEYPFFGIIGIFLFNITMPITLVVISNLLPGRPGFSFGLTTFALVFGYGLILFKPNGVDFSGIIIFITIVLSSAFLYYGLKGFFKYVRV